MGRYALRRLVQAVPLLLVMVVLTFVLVHLAPGDPIYALAGEAGDAAYYAEMRARFGLDRPLVEQLGIYLLNVARGDLGQSYVQKQAVLPLILGRLPATLLLMLPALALATALGLWLATLGATRRGSALDQLVVGATTALHGVPVFWLGQVLVIVFAVGFGLLPVQGMVSARSTATGLALAGEVLRHLALPALTLGLALTPLIARVARVSLADALAEEYVRTARAKGLPERRVRYGHALRNALLPVVTVVGGQVGTLLAGATLVEITFAWPGMGRLFYDATSTRDYPLLMALFLVVGVCVVLANLCTDLLYARLDPRVRLG